MEWGSLFTVFGMSTFKFMFAPLTGKGLSLPFWETFLACWIGGTFSAAIFFYSSELVIKLTKERREKKVNEALANGVAPPMVKRFTKMNRFIIRMKRSMGIYGICFWAPFFLSVPIGSVVVAKFYGNENRAFPLVILGMGINAMLMCSLIYGVM